MKDPFNFQKKIISYYKYKNYIKLFIYYKISLNQWFENQLFNKEHKGILILYFSILF